MLIFVPHIGDRAILSVLSSSKEVLILLLNAKEMPHRNWIDVINRAFDFQVVLFI